MLLLGLLSRTRAYYGKRKFTLTALQKTLDLPSFMSTLGPCVHNRTYLAKENTLITEYH